MFRQFVSARTHRATTCLFAYVCLFICMQSINQSINQSNDLDAAIQAGRPAAGEGGGWGRQASRVIGH